MKKGVILSVVFIFSGMIISCRKSYSCQCTTTVTIPDTDPVSSTHNEPLTEKMTKKQAKAACAHAEKQMNDNNTEINFAANDPSLGVNVNLSSTCSLQ